MSPVAMACAFEGLEEFEVLPMSRPIWRRLGVVSRLPGLRRPTVSIGCQGKTCVSRPGEVPEVPITVSQKMALLRKFECSQSVPDEAWRRVVWGTLNIDLILRALDFRGWHHHRRTPSSAGALSEALRL